MLIASAREQNLPEHRVEAFTGPKIDTALRADRILPAMSMIAKHRGPNAKPISRPARIEPEGIRKVATVMDEYLEDMLHKQDSLDTQRKLTRWTKQFVEVMGGMERAEIQPKHGYEYI